MLFYFLNKVVKRLPLNDYMWCRCIPRPHLGMIFTSIKLLDPVCIERMRRKHNIESGLIVELVMFNII
jgi:hypothetical protein